MSISRAKGLNDDVSKILRLAVNIIRRNMRSEYKKKSLTLHTLMYQ